MNRRECPSCRTLLAPPDPACPGCELVLAGAPAEELWRVRDELLDVERAIAGLRRRQRRLERAHEQLVDDLWTRSVAVAEPPPAPEVAEEPPPDERPVRERPRRDLSRHAVQNVLLLLGGLLLGIAAVVFTVVSWGNLGVRAVVLVAVTAGALAAPWRLTRRGLHSTAETVAFVGLMLVPLSGLAVVNAVQDRSASPEELGASGSGNAALWAVAGAAALLAAGWAGYARIAPLRLPGPTAVVLAQIPLTIAACAAGPTPAGIALALVLTAWFDFALWRGAGLGGAAGVVTGLAGAGIALAVSFTVWHAAGVLALAAVLAGVWGWRERGVPRAVASVVAGVSVVAALGAPAAVLLPGRWDVAGYALAACLVMAAARVLGPLRDGVVAAGAGALGLTVVWVSPQVAVAVTVRPEGGSLVAAVVVALAASAAVWWVRGAAVVLGAVAVLTAPVGTPVLLVVIAALLVLAAMARPVVVASCAVGSAGYVVAAVVVWSPSPGVALVAVVLAAACAVAARTVVVQVVAGAGAVLLAGVAVLELWPVALSLPFALLAVRVVAVAAGPAGLRARRPAQTLAVDAAGVVVSLAALVVATAEMLALALAVAAVVAGASAWSLRGTRVGAVAVGEAVVLAVLAPLPLGEALPSALFGPFGWVAHAWAGAPDGAREALAPGSAWAAEPLLVPVLVTAVTAAVIAAGAYRGPQAALGVARVAGPVALAPLPLAVDLPYWAALVFLVAMTAGLALWAAVSRSAAGGTALWTAALAVAWSLADPAATLAVLATLAVTGLLVAVRAGDSPAARTASAVTALAVGAEGAAAALAGDLPARQAAFVVLAVAVLSVRAGVLVRRRPGVAWALVAGGVVLWCAAVGMAGSRPDHLSLVLTVGALTCAGMAGRLRGEVRTGVLAWAVVVGAVGLMNQLAVLVAAVLGAYAQVLSPWTTAVAPDPVPLAVLASAAVAAVTGVVAARTAGGPAAGYTVATVAVPLVLVLVPPGLPHAAGTALVAALALAVAVRAAVARPADLLAGGTALWLVSLTVARSLATPSATLAVLAGVGVVAAGCAWRARNVEARAGAAALAVAAAGGLALAAPLAAGWRVVWVAFPVLAVASAAAVAAFPLYRRAREVSVAVECAGYGVAVCGVGLALPEVAHACAALVWAGVLASAVAARPERRSLLSAGVLLLHLALWLRLLTWEVTAPEAYTTMLALVLAVAGWGARESRAELSSWAAYGPALLVGFAPSLVVAWEDGGLTRPLALGLAAFAVTLAGAWWRLRAPLLFGSAVLVVNAAHELFPALAALMGQGPRWLPIAVMGAALLFSGATYEHRLRDLRRVRRSITRMR